MKSIRLSPRRPIILVVGTMACALCASADAGPPPPPNDACADATPVVAGTHFGDTSVGSTDGSAGCGDSNAAPDLWYLYTATEAGQLVVTTCGEADWDTVLSLHSACPGTAGNQLACNDDICSVQSRVVIPVAPDQQVWIRVAGWNGASGAFGIDVSLQPPPAKGADVLIGELAQFEQFGREGDIIGCGVDSPLCNAGGEPLDWFANPDPRHPFAISNLYRLHGVRLMHVGMSWAKHGFGAAQLDACGLGCQPYPDSTRLGQGCSDTYDAGTNAAQIFLGPRYEINPWTGAYVFEGSHLDIGAGGHDEIQHRLQIHDDDLDPAIYPGATYIVEEYIVAHDDDENHMNSVAHEPVGVSGRPGGDWSFDVSGSNTLLGPAIAAWPGAGLTTIPPEIVDDGRVILGALVSEVGQGSWHYEFAIYNHDLARGVQSFTIPLDPATKVSGIGFHAVRSHDEPYSNEDWTATRDADGITWQTQPSDVNPLSNPLRWGTMYNFWFDADAPAAPTTATLGLFEPGSPSSLSGATQGPLVAGIVGDLDGDGDVDVDDLLAVIAAWGPCPNCMLIVCPADLNGDCAVNVDDLLTVINNWG